jgi:hypothetical protein
LQTIDRCSKLTQSNPNLAAEGLASPKVVASQLYQSLLNCG